MTSDTLKNTLKELHAKLEASGNLDSELKQLLDALDADILRSERTDDDSSITSGLADRAQLLSAKFAAEHPTMEPILRELTDILGKMGI